MKLNETDTRPFSGTVNFCQLIQDIINTHANFLLQENARTNIIQTYFNPKIERELNLYLIYILRIKFISNSRSSMGFTRKFL